LTSSAWGHTLKLETTIKFKSCLPVISSSSTRTSIENKFVHI